MYTQAKACFSWDVINVHVVLLYTDFVNTASQFKSLCQELPRFVDLALGGNFLVVLHYCVVMCVAV